jgi:hypothetical protein
MQRRGKLDARERGIYGVETSLGALKYILSG